MQQQVLIPVRQQMPLIMFYFLYSFDEPFLLLSLTNSTTAKAIIVAATPVINNVLFIIRLIDLEVHRYKVARLLASEKLSVNLLG